MRGNEEGMHEGIVSLKGVVGVFLYIKALRGKSAFAWRACFYPTSRFDLVS